MLTSRRAAAALAGHTGNLAAALDAIADSEPSIRSLGFGALARLGALDEEHALVGLADPDTRVVRRVIECLAQPGSITVGLVTLDDALVNLVEIGPDVVAETAAWALGERHQPTEETSSQDELLEPREHVMRALIHATTSHDDALVRESAAAALGAIGHTVGLPAVLIATQDKATVRRRAVLALAAFDGPEVHDALVRARTDRDWQVRQAAEDLLNGELA